MSQRLQSTLSTSQKTIDKKSIYGVVCKVILDDSQEEVLEYDFSENETKNTSIIGYAKIKRFDAIGGGDCTTAELYPPFDLSQGLPINGESVLLTPIGGILHYKRGYSNDVSSGNAKLDKYGSIVPNNRESKSSSNYNEVSSTKTSQSQTNNSPESKFGEYYQPQQINPLKLYEGDSLIQSRFGQTIRLSGYNNEGNTFSPTIIIRNRQSGEVETNEKRGTLIEEDINKDGSSIVLSSRDYKIDLKPGTIDDGGSQQLDTKPKAFDPYPSELTGTDQILINSGRVVLSSKKDEMIFISKGDYGFISDGKFSIDNGNAGAELDFNGDVRITTNDNNTFILGNNGEIFLNTEERTEPLVRGETLLNLLDELLTAITQQVYLTPAGPSGTGPTNIAAFESIKNRLGTIKSTKNYTE